LNFEKMILADYALLKKRMMQSADGSCGNVVFCKQEERGSVFAKAPPGQGILVSSSLVTAKCNGAGRGERSKARDWSRGAAARCFL